MSAFSRMRAQKSSLLHTSCHKSTFYDLHIRDFVTVVRRLRGFDTAKNRTDEQSI